MAHWEKELPLPILKMPYEELVSDFKGRSAEMIDYIGLDWDDACMNFHSSSGMVRTASKWQVREPIYTSAIDRWKPYEDYLTPFTDQVDFIQ